MSFDKSWIVTMMDVKNSSKYLWVSPTLCALVLTEK